jgi:hypothetical protein
MNQGFCTQGINEADHLSASTVKLKNAWAVNSSSSIHLHEPLFRWWFDLSHGKEHKEVGNPQNHLRTKFRIVFWDVLPCKIIVGNYFTQQYIPEDNSELHTRRRKNLKNLTLEYTFWDNCVVAMATSRGKCIVSHKNHIRPNIYCVWKALPIAHFPTKHGSWTDIILLLACVLFFYHKETAETQWFISVTPAVANDT